jgi:hypothetical protein
MVNKKLINRTSATILPLCPYSLWMCETKGDVAMNHNIKTNTALQARIATGQTTAGFLASQMVFTLDGPCPAAKLRPHQWLVSRNSGSCQIAAIETVQRWVECVQFAADVFGQPLRLCADQPILMRPPKGPHQAPAALIAARDLLNGGSTVLEEARPTVLRRIVMEEMHILYVDGVELLSAAPSAPHILAA